MLRIIRNNLLKLSPVQIMILTIWALMMVSLPIVDWSSGWSVMVGAITIGAIISAGLVTALLWGAWGAAKTLRAAGAILFLSWAAEVIGTRFGIPFSKYDYTNSLQPQILNVPVQIPLGWLMLLPPSWAVAQAIANRVNPRWEMPAFVGISALAMTAWDLFLDPMMVTWGMWVWNDPGSYFGIPWTNFLGWLLVSAAITLLIRPGKLPVVPLLIMYTAIWLLNSVGLGLIWGIYGAAVVGSVFMGSLTILAWRAVSIRD